MCISCYSNEMHLYTLVILFNTHTQNYNTIKHFTFNKKSMTSYVKNVFDLLALYKNSIS